MRIAYFSPLPPQRTGIADYSVELLPALLRQARVDLFIDQAIGAESLPPCAMFNYVDKPALLHELSRYDAIIYHMGNSPAHRNIFPVLLEYPGIVVLHDFVLHHFLAGYYMESLRAPESYVEEMRYNHGVEGEEAAREVLKTGTWIWEHQPLRYPLNKRVLDSARGLIVHSELAAAMVRKSHAHLPIAKINMPVRTESSNTQLPQDDTELRRRYKIPDGRVVLGSFGSASHAKRTDITVRAIAALDRKDIIYLLVGEMGDNYRRQIQAGMGDMVRITGYVDADAFTDYCRLIDVGIDLRDQTMGESSLTVCRMMAAGKPCVISDFGWFAEIPDGCVVKVDAAADQQTLGRALSRLIADKQLRLEIGERARTYMREHQGVDQAAAAYVDFVGQVGNLERGGSAERAIVDETGRAMAELGVSDSDDWLIGGIAEEIATLFRPDRG